MNTSISPFLKFSLKSLITRTFSNNFVYDIEFQVPKTNMFVFDIFKIKWIVNVVAVIVQKKMYGQRISTGFWFATTWKFVQRNFN